MACIMKSTSFSVALLLCAATLAQAATNGLTEALQKGLFEEEANHNLNAAITAYQSLVGQFDKDRKLAATAVFRLGECYRKLGRTNAALAQYQRVVTEFTDQPTLVTLSRQNLASLGSAGPESAAPPAISPAARLESKRLLEERIKLAEQDVADTRKQFDVGHATQSDVRAKEQEVLELRQQMAALDLGAPQPGAASPVAASTASAVALAESEAASDKAQIERLKGLQGPERRIAVQLDYPNPVLTKLMQQSAETEQKLATLRNDYAESHPEVVKTKAALDAINKQIDEQVNGVIAGLQAKMAAALDTAKSLRAQLASAGPGAGAESATGTDEEEREIRRVQAMIQNSPDLINAPDPNNQNYTPLQSAAELGQMRVAQYLLDHGAEVDRARSQGRTPLYLAASRGHNAMVELVLNREAKVDARDTAGWTPLYEVAGRGFKTVAETLLAHKADVKAKAVDGRTPLHRAADSGQLALVELLLAHGADVNVADNNGDTPMMVAAMNANNSAAIKALLAAKADLNAQDNVGRTALSYAVERGGIGSVGALLDAKADPNGGERDLPLAMTVKTTGTNVAELLLRAGADPNREAAYDLSDLKYTRGYYARDTKCTPLQVVLGVNRPDLAMLFLQFKGDPNAKLPNADRPLVWEAIGRNALLNAFLKAGANPNTVVEGGTLLLREASDGDAPAIQTLLAADAEVNPTGVGADSPLLAAVRSKGDEQTIRLLLDAGAHVNRRDAQEYTPLLRAIDKRRTSIAALLLAHGADPNLAFLGSGETPLQFAVGIPDPSLVQLLLTNKADVNLRRKDGKTALDLAKEIAARPVPSTSGMMYSASGPVQVQFGPGFGATGLPGGTPVPAGAPGSSNSPSQAATLADLLRQHGALDNLPRFDFIQVTRPSANYARTVFWKGTNDWNHFTLLDAICAAYPGDLPSATQGSQGTFSDRLRRSVVPDLPFPNLHRLVLLRPNATAGKPSERTAVDLLSPTGAVDCSKDIPLQFGDVVEINEREHTLEEQPIGLTQEQVQQLVACRKGTVSLVVRDKTTALTVWPLAADARIGMVLDRSVARSALFSSSDLGRVKVTRRDAKTGKKQEWVVDCSGGNSPDFWLRDGDVIEVPEK